jgi:hypothetical protein
MSRSFSSRNSSVLVTVGNSVMCGAVNADATNAAAVCLRTPLTRLDPNPGIGTDQHAAPGHIDGFRHGLKVDAEVLREPANRRLSPGA